ncbi:hypothetical protein [Bradyrhizobium canariense]|uniref:hypothetical protein n=1 Tax=Bradyrhizobium canariense TaxID=255045 RepID=UPI001F0B4881|nr:hypothetical protein [Bradyrhizobium canariense]
MAINRVRIALFSVAAVLTSSSAIAQTVPPEGSLSVIFIATPIPMPIGGGREFVFINQAMAASNEAGNPVLNNMGGRCQLSRLTGSSARPQRFTGCALTSTRTAINCSSSATGCLDPPTIAP